MKKNGFKIRSMISLLLILGFAAFGCESGPLSSPAGGEVLFQDDFSDPSSGWLQGEDEIGKAEYYRGGFHIFLATDVSGKLSVPRLNFDDVRVEVDATKIGGPDDNDFGIVCRLVDENNFYFFEISSDGYYGIGKYINNVLMLISSTQMQASDAILQGTATNHIRADCKGSILTLYVNGVKLAEAKDSDFQAGDVGLIAGTFETPGVDILFDNFSVLKP